MAGDGYPHSSVLLAGIGRSIVKALHAAGAGVVAVSRTQADLDSLVREVGATLSQPGGSSGELRAAKEGHMGAGRWRLPRTLSTPAPRRTRGRTTILLGLWRRQKWLLCWARGARTLGGSRLAGGGARSLILKPLVELPKGQVNPPPTASWETQKATGSPETPNPLSL